MIKNVYREILAGLIFAALFSFVFYVFASPLYNPGDTISPTCDLSSSDCTVTAPAIYSFGSNNFSGTGTFTTTDAITGGHLKDSSLTSGRVAYLTTGGQLIDNANLTFNGTTLTTGGLTTGGLLTINANNIATDTTTGMKIGTATNQLLGFFNSTPIVKPSGDIISALSNEGLVASPALSYGSMYIYNLDVGAETVTATAKDTFYQIPAGITGGPTNGFTFQNARELKCNIAGTYLITYSSTMEVNAANQEVEETVMINGVEDTTHGFASHSEEINTSRPFVVSASGIITLAANDLVSLAVLEHTSTGKIIEIDHLSLTISRLQ